MSNVRRANITDLTSILAIERQASTASHWTPSQYHKLLDSGVILVAEKAGATDGFLCAQAVAGEWEIESVVVDRASLRSGIASELVRELIRLVRAEKSAVILLEVRESNLPARALYAKHGFNMVGRRPSYYQSPSEDAIQYAFRVTP
jgi:ribosomal-protein-alanine N-acetyltransferase